ncbi:enoyl-CoA hydratase-related protein [Microbacterium sp. NPDC089320]|uniref:enoyl-CoA hydratase-related protein n=1 Tax=Microbacterium sp. NPDC089320 TaxID=3155182 RepID=UPI0034469EBA
MTADDDRIPDEARVSLEVRGRTLVITMTRVDKRNAIDASMTAALDEALDLLDRDPDLRCGVLTGGATVFSAGTDLAEGAGPPTARGGEYGLIRRPRRTPLIAAVEGAALGGGFELVLACDMVVAGASARFGLPEVSRGVVPTCGGLFRTSESLPMVAARRLALTGRPLDATDAHARGLVNEVVADGAALDGALALADEVVSNSPSAVAAVLDALRAVEADRTEAGWSATASALARIEDSPDRYEGVAAFLEKREPRWAPRVPVEADTDERV